MKFLLPVCILLLLCYSTFAYPPAWQGKRDQQARDHLERANEFEAWDDPRAEQEYKLAIKVRGGRYPEALQELSWHLQRKLHFSEGRGRL